MQPRDPEYDRFGPWIVEISPDDPAPPLFVPFLDRTEAPRLSLKVPRQIERRRAHPGMDLYDYMVNLYEEDMLILMRVGHEVEARALRYRDIRSLRVREDLLRGRLRLAALDGTYELPYNTVSNALVGRLVDLVRERYLPPGSAAPPTAGPRPPSAGLSFHFERIVAAEARSAPEMRLLASQPETQLGSRERNRIRRVLFSVVGKRVLETLHFSDGHELKIIGRGPTYAHRWQAIYGTEVCFVPVAALTESHWDDGGQTDRLVELRLRTATDELSYAFRRDNADLPSYRSALERMVASARG